MLLTITQGDTHPAVNFKLSNPATKAAVNLTGATLTFTLRAVGADTPVFSKTATILSALNGTARYAWDEGDTDIAGTFHGSLRVVFPGGEKQTTNLMGFYISPSLSL